MIEYCIGHNSPFLVPRLLPGKHLGRSHRHVTKQWFAKPAGLANMTNLIIRKKPKNTVEYVLTVIGDGPVFLSHLTVDRFPWMTADYEMTGFFNATEATTTNDALRSALKTLLLDFAANKTQSSSLTDHVNQATVFHMIWLAAHLSGDITLQDSMLQEQDFTQLLRTAISIMETLTVSPRKQRGVLEQSPPDSDDLSL